MSTNTATKLVEQVARLALHNFASIGLVESELAISLSCLDTTVSGHFYGDKPAYPASIVKLFYLVAAHHWLEDHRLAESAEVQQALYNMIVHSSNDATHYIVDVLTDTTSGPELPPPEMQVWIQKRNLVNDYFQSLGYTGININQKPWEDAPYGRDDKLIKLTGDKRNVLTTNATARLLTEIVNGQAVTPARSKSMLSLLSRDYSKSSCDPFDQATQFTAKGLPKNSKLWSKAGWTSIARHDAAYIELPSGKRLVLVIFTMNHAQEEPIIPFIASHIIAGLETS